MRATTRAWAAAAVVHRPRRTGITFSFAHRLRVEGETPEILDASPIEIVVSGTLRSY
jgi:hypothetical protein